MSHARARLAVALLVLFLLAAAARLLAIPIALPVDLARWSTYALMPSLALWVLARRGPALVVAALLCSAVGDVLLGYGEALFLFGMGAFALAHIGYIACFVRAGALRSLRHRPSVLAGYAVALVGLVGWLWPGLGDLRYPVAVYALLLTGTAVASAGVSVRMGFGGALFFVSDALIAVGLADRPQPPMPSMWVMTTYILAQYLLASGSVQLVRKASPAAESYAQV
ncbi:MAG TPA: lysoplasmalogenase [Micromonosporaceae bacterium]